MAGMQQHIPLCKSGSGGLTLRLPRHPVSPTQKKEYFNAARHSRIAAVCCFSPPSPLPATLATAPTTSIGVRISPPPHTAAPYSKPSRLPRYPTHPHKPPNVSPSPSPTT
ncbi:hypothetical protein TraAM80_10399 [Trypanosoma rangeli]|uniref:Uncharacterized protein n=1 Tax=Trypanosoma rangeli TaxID=5698 RepID=A0A3R7LDJ6_TRYRA|nr:uncharacterized protein TraAM80_10399 [Trypanosoma rangeli]RNE95098.1 hypothetical protein TraAM80_10399 [Trypanosoma rangeli]|eukprot:RNE95098.1 hypothetical protein TraAM80_10399 [Trypanosoma rangeli]